MKHNELVEIIENQTGEKPKQRELAEALNVGVAVIGKRAERNSSYNLDELLKIDEWFGTKYFEFDLFQATNTNQVVKNVIGKVQNNIEAAQDSFLVEYYPDVFGSCGAGGFVLSETNEFINIPKKIVQDYSRVKHYSVINAYGDSMMPYIHDKDLLVVQHYDGEQIRDNRVYVFRFKDSIFVKRLVLNITQLIIKSDNTKYKPMTVDLTANSDDIQIIGQIVGLMRNMG